MENEQQQFPYQSVYTFTYMLHMNDSAASSKAKKIMTNNWWLGTDTVPVYSSIMIK